MPRPKGSKNKSTLEREAVMEAPKEFNYEEDDGKFDSNFNQIYSATGPAVAMTDLPPAFAAFGVGGDTDQAKTQTTPNPTGVFVNQGTQLFLVEGEVQLSSREPGRSTMVAKQTRLVSAANDDQAIQKFVRYFAGLSDAQSVYTVINAAAMETIQ